MEAAAQQVVCGSLWLGGVEEAVNGGGVAHQIVGGEFQDGILVLGPVVAGAADDLGGDGASVDLSDFGDDGGIEIAVFAAAIQGEAAWCGGVDLAEEAAFGEDVLPHAEDVHPAFVFAEVEFVGGPAALADDPGDEAGGVAPAFVVQGVGGCGVGAAFAGLKAGAFADGGAGAVDEALVKGGGRWGGGSGGGAEEGFGEGEGGLF